MRHLTVVVWLMALGAWEAGAQKSDFTPLQLKALAPHIVVGTVYRVYESKEVTPESVMVRYVAEVHVESVEKGTGIAQDGLMYVRFWKRTWVARQASRGKEGHRYLPAQGAKGRFFLSRYTYDGFGSNLDGGLNLIGPNGFEKLPSEPYQEP